MATVPGMEKERAMRNLVSMTCLSLVLLALAGTSPAIAAGDVLIADFEGKDYGGWKVEGEAFGKGPAKGKFNSAGSQTLKIRVSLRR